VCKAPYIPFDEAVPCPNCGTAEQKRFPNFINLAADSVRYNMRRYGSYMPNGWALTSFADRILLTIFQIFEKYREQGSTQPFEDFSDQVLSEVDWGERRYLQQHVYDIAKRIHEELQRQA
jgi:hypothetical protein